MEQSVYTEMILRIKLRPALVAGALSVGSGPACFSAKAPALGVGIKLLNWQVGSIQYSIDSIVSIVVNQFSYHMLSLRSHSSHDS